MEDRVLTSSRIAWVFSLEFGGLRVMCSPEIGPPCFTGVDPWRIGPPLATGSPVPSPAPSLPISDSPSLPISQSLPLSLSLSLSLKFHLSDLSLLISQSHSLVSLSVFNEKQKNRTKEEERSEEK
jgi:hypothetical protein